MKNKTAANNPEYIIESHFRGDPENTEGPRCQFRRYVVEIYLQNCIACSGELKLHHGAGIFYYLGNVPLGGISTDISHTTTKKYGGNPLAAENENTPYYGYDIFKTEDITVSWKSETPVNALGGRRKLATLMLCFCRWGMEYSEIEKYSANELISADSTFSATADGAKAAVSNNNYVGVVVPSDISPTPPPFEAPADKGTLLSRFAVMADAHIGARYNWENYDWLYSAFSGIEKLHREKSLDFVVQLGDNIDDGYANSYKADYEVYLEKIKDFKICDPVNPIYGRKAGTVPHYELQGNHDTSMDTRFIRNKLWYTENAQGQRVAYISFFTSYGGYPLYNFSVSKSYGSYRSYGVLSNETVNFIEQSIMAAQNENVKHIILLSHFGISQEVGAPILPESGLGKIALLCKKYGIKLCFNGHEHNKDFTHRMYGNVHDFDVSMLRHKYAVVEIYENMCEVTVYDTDDGTVFRTDLINL